jgi:hypothetical protein
MLSLLHARLAAEPEKTRPRLFCSVVRGITQMSSSFAKVALIESVSKFPSCNAFVESNLQSDEKVTKEEKKVNTPEGVNSNVIRELLRSCCRLTADLVVRDFAISLALTTCFHQSGLSTQSKETGKDDKAAEDSLFIRIFHILMLVPVSSLLPGGSCFPVLKRFLGDKSKGIGRKAEIKTTWLARGLVRMLPKFLDANESLARGETQYRASTCQKTGRLGYVLTLSGVVNGARVMAMLARMIADNETKVQDGRNAKEIAAEVSTRIEKAAGHPYVSELTTLKSVILLAELICVRETRNSKEKKTEMKACKKESTDTNRKTNSGTKLRISSSLGRSLQKSSEQWGSRVLGFITSALSAACPPTFSLLHSTAAANVASVLLISFTKTNFFGGLGSRGDMALVDAVVQLTLGAINALKKKLSAGGNVKDRSIAELSRPLSTLQATLPACTSVVFLQTSTSMSSCNTVSPEETLAVVLETWQSCPAKVHSFSV